MLVLVLACAPSPDELEKPGETGDADTDADTDTDTDADADTDTDETGCPPLYGDADGDGFGDPAAMGCEGVQDGTDCDDQDPTVHPGAEEVCGDADDDDCDGNPDVSAVAEVWHSDDDGDGYGHMYVTETSCDPPPGWVLDGEDCRPGDAEAHPGATERCNDDDDDCDSLVDEDFELDGDGHTSEACGGDDCDDLNADAFPGNTEVCDDGVDDDCDGHDAHCAYDGTFDLGTDADVKAWSGSANFDAGRLVEVGDLDADGYEDVVIPVMYADGYNGGAYVLYGPLATSGTLETLGVRIEGDPTTYAAGRSVGVGDVDGDGVDDVAIGAPDGTDKEWIVFGPVEADMDLVDADVYMTGNANTEFGHGSDLADVDGDGVADAVVGAYEDDEGGYVAGTVYVEYGPLSAGLYDLPAEADARLVGDTSGAYAGRYVRAGGDVDGDGVGDILAAAPYSSDARPYGGAAHLVYGGVTGDFDLASSDGYFLGEAANDYASEELALGDVDGDGLADVILGSYNGSGGARQAGTLYVVLGPASGTHDLGAADVIVRGTTANQQFGLGIAARDIDADGVDDLLVGAIGDGGSGAAYLFFGPVVSGLDPTDADATLLGEGAGDQAGEGVAIADLDADGLGDLLIGAPAEGTGGSAAGAVYVRYPSP